MSFSSPVWLLALLLPPAAAVTQRLARARAARYALRFPAVATLRQASATTRDHRRHIAAACLLLAAAALAVALARPHVASAIAVRQASLVLVLDHSGSMAAVDVQPTRSWRRPLTEPRCAKRSTRRWQTAGPQPATPWRRR